MNENNNAGKKQKRNKKDLNLAESRFQLDCEEWLPSRYNDIAKVLYNRHVVKKQHPQYKSERIQSIAYKCLGEYEHHPDSKAPNEVLASLRIRLSDKVKHHNTFDVLDFEDYLDILDITPNEILKIAPELSANPMRTIKVLSKDQAKDIRDKFSQFSNGKKSLCLTCLCFPMFGILGVMNIYGPRYYGWGDASPSVYYAILIPRANMDSEKIYQRIDFSSYEQMEEGFYRAVCDEADNKQIDNWGQLEGFKLFVDHFKKTDYLIGYSAVTAYQKPFAVSATDNPTA